jgi:hypothetical protein
MSDTQISAKELAAIAKDANTSLWWQHVEGWLKNTINEAQANIDRLEREFRSDNQLEWARWVTIKNTVQELLNLRQAVIQASESPQLKTAIKDQKQKESKVKKSRQSKGVKQGE